jgi:hypothetical protein
MIEYYTKLASLRRSLVPLRTGSTTMLFTNASVLAFARVAAPHMTPIVVLNKGSRPATVAVPVRGLYPNGATLEIGLGDGQTQVAGGRVSVTVAPRSGVVLIGG